MPSRGAERASVAPVLVGVVAVLAAVTAGLGRTATASVARARADAAADMVALAAAHDGSRAATVAQRSGADIEALHVRPDGVTEVVVVRDGVRGRAAASVVSAGGGRGGLGPPR